MIMVESVMQRLCDLGGIEAGANMHGVTVTTVREQASEEQQKSWLPRILNYDIIGCYAQTELGHGSNVRGLETVAKWDPVAKEFEIHSPTLTASKWWNGSMGRTATHAVRISPPTTPCTTFQNPETRLENRALADVRPFLDCCGAIALAAIMQPAQREQSFQTTQLFRRRLRLSRPANLHPADPGSKDAPASARYRGR